MMLSELALHAAEILEKLGDQPVLIECFEHNEELRNIYAMVVGQMKDDKKLFSVIRCATLDNCEEAIALTVKEKAENTVII